jgi:hypothetical protein
LPKFAEMRRKVEGKDKRDVGFFRYKHQIFRNWDIYEVWVLEISGFQSWVLVVPCSSHKYFQASDSHLN